MKKPNLTIFVIIITVILAGGIYFWLNKKTPPVGNNNTNTVSEKTYPEVGNYPLYSLKDLTTDYKNETLKVGRYNTEGFIIDTFECPPCPFMAVCVPCQPDTLIVSEENKSPIDTKETVRIKAENLDQFAIGQKYKFSISINEETVRIGLLGYSTL